jgi:tetratricopeptide (TPR) repeat protein/TolB-like protein
MARPAPTLEDARSGGKILRWLPVITALNEEPVAPDAAVPPRADDCERSGGGSNMPACFARTRVTLTPGARLGPYEIVAPLGSGGMGVVYRAHDSRLDRVVAIKVLGSSAETAQHRQRFQREMRAIAALNHPNICALYDVGLQDDVEFFVMEYLEGETLAMRLLKGPLPLVDTLRHAAALADAVALAHRHGIVHRDIKPSNIMITASGVKLLDFGLAKLAQPRGKAVVAGLAELSTASNDITGAHTILGTLRYMAPEQLEGAEADARTDIFALGVVFYEMASGAHAFSHQSDAGLISRILTHDPVPLTDRLPAVPPNFDFAVRVCLAKSPDERWQSAHDLARALTWIKESGPAAGPKPGVRWWQRRRRWLAAASIAAAAVAVALAGLLATRSNETRNLVILPCTVMTGNAADQAYCEGMTDAIAGKLLPLAVGQTLQLTPAREARTRSVTTVVEARRQLGATLVLQGSVLRDGDDLRVAFDLLDAATLRQIEGYTMIAAAADPFAIQDRVVQWAARSLALKVDDAQLRALIDHDTANGAARELYLQGYGFLTDPRAPANVDSAIDRFTRALQLDGRYSLALAGLGRAYWLKYSVTRDAQFTDRARTACLEAVQIDQRLAAARVCLGMIANGSGRYADARDEYMKALDLDPASDEALPGLAFAEEHLGNPDAAEDAYRRAVDRRPQYWATRTWLAQFYRDQGRYREAAAQFNEAVKLTPDNPAAWFALGSAYLYMGRYTDAAAAYDKSLALAPTFNAYQALGMTYYRMRRFDEAVTVLEQARRLSANYRGPGSLARVYFWQGKNAEARALFESAIAGIQQSLQVNPNDVDAHLLLAEFHAKLGHHMEAASEMLRAGDVSSNPHRLLFGAIVHNQLGDRAKALDWLERASKKGLPRAELAAWIEFDNLHDDPRFQALLDAAR